jgi:hypothetical protein
MARWSTCSLASLAFVLAIEAGAPASAAPAEDAVMPLEQYTTAKARSLATSHRPELLRLNEDIYHCMPWVEVRTNGIGFRAPRWAQRDERYLSVWILIDQHDDGRFAAVEQERRASAMFSRYGVNMMRRMAALLGVASDPDVDGFSVVLSWPRPRANGRPGGEPVNETLALFVDKSTALEFLARRLPAEEFTNRAKFSVFDGKVDLGRLPLEVWEDPFVETFKLKGYQPAAGKTC